MTAKKWTLLVLFSVVGYIPLQAQTSPLTTETKAYRHLQTLSGNNLNTSTRIPEDSIIRLSHEVEVLARASRNIAHEFKAGQIQANAYGLKGNLGLAASKTQQLIEKAARTKNQLAMGLAIQALGDTYMHADRFDQADSVFSEALPYILKYGDSFMQLQLYLQKLHVSINQRDTIRANATIRQVQKILDTDSSIPGASHYQFTLTYYEAIVAIEMRDTLQAKKLLEDVNRKKPEELLLSDYWFHSLASQYYKCIAQYDEALIYSDTVLISAQAEPNIHILRQALMSRTELLELIGANEEACNIYSQLTSMSDSLYKAQYISQIDSLHIAYMVDHLQMSNIIRRNALYTKVIIGLLCLVLTAVVVGLFIRRQNHRLVESRRRLQAMREATADSIRSKSLFLSNMSHELRTPLNAIMGFSTILIEDDEVDEETQQQCSGYIRQNADLLMKLINDVVNVAELQGTSIRFAFAPCDMVLLCRNVLETVNNVKQTQARMQFETELGELILCTDMNRLQQVLINLLVNATKFTAEGDIRLRLHIDPAHDEAVFTIEDTGCGIPKEKQPNIFERYEKLHEGVQGAGLGLSICKLIVEYMDGRIWIDPDYTEGARFIFTHPLHYTPKEDRK